MARVRRRNRLVRRENLPFHVGYEWGDSLDGDGRLRVERVGTELTVTAGRPAYQSENLTCDLMRQYSESRKNRSIGKQRTGKDSPHIRFANADSDDELIEFIRSFGPVVCTTSIMRASMDPKSSPKGTGDEPVGLLLKARQNFQELRNEQKIYRAALSLIVQLAKEEIYYDREDAKKQIAEIARGVKKWPHQWQREKKGRDKDPLWRIREKSIQRIVRLARSKPAPLLAPQLDARIVLCEILNVFPLLAFPNPLEMHSYIRFGIRPLLYNVLRREFLQPRDTGACANTHCREFFEIERKGQRFCDEVCSRQQRQREYWKTAGKTLRRKRLKSQKKANR